MISSADADSPINAEINRLLALLSRGQQMFDAPSQLTMNAMFLLCSSGAYVAWTDPFNAGPVFLAPCSADNVGLSL